MKQIVISEINKTFVLDEGLLYINGGWKKSRSEQTYKTFNPANGESIVEVAAATIEDVDDAVQAAKDAFEGEWSSMAPSSRADFLFKIADLIERNAEAIAFTEAIDMGMLYKDSLNVNIPHVVKMFRYYAGWVTKIEGRTKPVEGWPGEHLFCYTRKEPLGVVAGITPFNFPLVLSVSKIAPALAAGNTFVHKPSPSTPLSAIKLAEIMHEAGLPKGVYNLITGPDWQLGSRLTKHPDVKKVTLTGSTQTGKQIIKDGADTLKHITVELGGKSPHIIFADANLDRAVEYAFFALFWNKGEVCVAGSRLLVEKKILDKFIEKLVLKMQKTIVGNPFDPSSDYGPMSGKNELDKVLRYIDIGKNEGAQLLSGGNPKTINGKGYYVEPSLFLADNSMQISREEIFGPVLPIIPFEDFDEAIRLANDTPFGLASGVQTSDLRKALKASELLQSGMVWLNTWHHYSPAAPFGGYKQSGFGRENGEEALDHFMQIKTVWMDLNG